MNNNAACHIDLHLFIFFKQKTAYEMRISDWSSDVCSSDLDGSDDGTAGCIDDLDVTVLRHPQRMGKGAALRSGFAQARRFDMQGVVTMDGDGQHGGADIPRLIDAADRKSTRLNSSH